MCPLVTMVAFLLVTNCVNANYVISSPKVTNWGDWGDLVYCPSGQYVNGMELKVEPIRRRGMFGYSDNTALNAIRLRCESIGKSINYVNASKITSKESDYGNWGTVKYCPEHTFVTGFQLRSERSRGTNFFSWILGLNANDDTATNNIILFCSGKTSSIEGYGTTEGAWTSEQHCLERQAVCGFRTQVEPYQGKGDDTALNNVDMICCDIPNPAKNCTPEETWDVIKECDNTLGVTPLTCSYQKKVGISHSKVTAKTDAETYRNLGFEFGSIETALITQFGSSGTGASSNIWKSGKTKIRFGETVHGLSFTVPPGFKTELIQVVGTCGIYSIRTPKFIRSDTNMLNQTSLNDILEETTTKHN